MKKSLTILDIGTGKGNKIPQLKKRGEVIGIDVSPEIIANVKQRFPDIKFFAMDCGQLSFPDSYFSEIYCYDVLEHVVDLPRSLAEISRVLQPNGKLFIEVPYWRSEQSLLRLHPAYFSEIGHRRIFTPEIQRTFLDYGLQLIKTSRKHGIVNLELRWQFKRGVSLKNQQGEYDREVPFILKVIFMLCNENLFLTPIKYLFPIWLVTLPIGLIISQIYPKTLQFELRKI